MIADVRQGGDLSSIDLRGYAAGKNEDLEETHEPTADEFTLIAVIRFRQAK